MGEDRISMQSKAKPHDASQRVQRQGFGAGNLRKLDGLLADRIDLDLTVHRSGLDLDRLCHVRSPLSMNDV